jgi:hypothetical protein
MAAPAGEEEFVAGESAGMSWNGAERRASGLDLFDLYFFANARM